MKKKTPEKAETTARKAAVFPKSALMISRRYADQRDALSFLLKDEETYTLEAVDRILDDYMKGQVK